MSEGYINEASSRSGYFFSSACTLAGASCLFLLQRTSLSTENQRGSFTGSTDNHIASDMAPFGRCDNHIPPDMPPFSVPLENGNNGPQLIGVPPRCTCGMEVMNPVPNYDQTIRRLNKNISFASSMDGGNIPCRPELLTCVSEEGMLEPCCQTIGDSIDVSCPVNDRFKTLTPPCNRYNLIPHVLPRPYFEEERFVPTFHSQSLPRRYPQNQSPYPRNTYTEVGSLPRGFSTQSCRKLRQSSAVSFSEPEGLARIGSQYPTSLHETIQQHHNNQPPPPASPSLPTQILLPSFKC